MGSSLVNSPSLLLGIFVLYYGICVNGRTHAAPNHVCDDGSANENCTDSLIDQFNSEMKIRKKIKNVFNQIRTIEKEENMMLEKIKSKAQGQKFIQIRTIEKEENMMLEKIKSKAQGQKSKKVQLMDSFMKRIKGKKPKAEELHAKAKENKNTNTKDDAEEEIYRMLWNIDMKAQGCVGQHLGENGTINFNNTELTENWRSCIWIINTTTAEAFEISFSSFSLNSCETLIIGDGITLRPIVTLSGPSIPGSVLLPQSNGYILFNSTCQTKSAEFTLHWSIVDSGCDVYYNNDYGMINHPSRIFSNRNEYIFSNYTYSNNENCTWVITSKPKRMLLWSIKSEECCDFLYVRDGNSSKSNLLKIFGGTQSRQYIYTTSSSVHLQFTSDYSNTAKGFSIMWSPIEERASCGAMYNTESGTINHPGSGNRYLNDENCIWIINSTVPLEIFFTSFNTERCCDFLYIRDGISSGSPLLGRNSGNYGNELVFLLPTAIRTTGSAYIQFTSDRSNERTGFVLHWNNIRVDGVGECGGTFTNNSGSIQYPARGGGYPPDASCTWVIVSTGGQIELNIKDFNTQHWFDFLYIRDGENNSAPLIGRYSGNALPFTVRTTANKAFIHFTSDNSVNGGGFNLTWNTVGCGAVFNDNAGIIRHPATGGNYENSEICTWIIQNTYQIDITFVEFDIERGFDYLYIRNGENVGSPVLGRFTGSDVPSSVQTETNKAHLRFTSDSSITSTGFVLRWNSANCGAHYNSNNGVIRHPLTSGNYSNNSTCTWIISTFYPITITFISFDTEEESDYLYVRDGESIGSSLLGSYSGSSLPQTLQTSTNKAHIQFTSDSKQTKTGFQLRWTSRECGSHYRSDSGVIRYPLTGELYANNQHCIWTIETSGPMIEFTFSNFSTEDGCDILSIRDGDNNESPLMGNFSGHFPATLSSRTSTSKAYLSFTSDASIVRSGFIISWNTAAVEGNSDCTCGTVNSEQEIVGGEDVEYKVNYPWHVGLFRQNGSGYYFCGGTLISEKYVLTAAHCVINYYDRWGPIMVRIGDHIPLSTTEDIEGITEAVSVEKIYVHSAYHRITQDNDFALLRLSKSITLTDGFGIRPICLPNTDPIKTYTGESGLSVGWGKLSTSSRLRPDTLQQVEMTILSPECNGWSRITPVMMCAFSQGKDTCQGDSGGSLAVLEKENVTNEHYVLTGVVSWGIGCAARTPGVYSRVTTALDWIQRFTVTCERRGG